MKSIKEISFTVMGEPQGKARPRFSFKNGKPYTPKNTKVYENRVRGYASILNCKFKREVPLEVNIQAYYKIPKSTSKKAKQQMLTGETLPTKKPDCDNVAKIILDALNGVLYEDDAQACRLNFEKLYSASPCVSIRIKTIGIDKPEEPKPKKELSTKCVEALLKNAGEEWRARRGFKKVNQDIDALHDEYLSNELKKHEERIKPVWVCQCDKCGEDLYEEDEAYYFDFDFGDIHICEDCIWDYKISL